MGFFEYHIRGYEQMTFFLIFLLTTEVAASITNSKNVTKGFCDQDQVKLTLSIDCNFTGISVSIHSEKVDFSSIILQCDQVTCHSLGSMTYHRTKEKLEVSFQFQYREHAGKYVNFKTTCQNLPDVIDQVFLKPCLSGFTGNATLVGSDVIIYCEHSSFNESETGISITDHEKTLATCTRGTCFGGHSLPNGAYCQVQYKSGMIILCMIDGAVLNLTNEVITTTTTPLSSTSIPALLTSTQESITSTKTSRTPSLSSTTLTLASTSSTPSSTESTLSSPTSSPASTISTPSSTTSTPASTTSTKSSTTSSSVSTTSTPSFTTSSPASTTLTPESSTSTPESSSSIPESSTSTPESTPSTPASSTASSPLSTTSTPSSTASTSLSTTSSPASTTSTPSSTASTSSQVSSTSTPSSTTSTPGKATPASTKLTPTSSTSTPASLVTSPIPTIAANVTNSNNETKGFCDQDQVMVTLTIDCDYSGIYVAIHSEKADFSSIILQCDQLTCHSLGSMTYHLTKEKLEVFFQFQYREHAGKYINFKITCQNQTDVTYQVSLKPCLSGFTGNATLVGSDVTIYCEHSSYNESETGISIADHEKTLATCILGTCLGGHSLPNGAYYQVKYKTGMILLCIIDGAVLNLTNSVIAPTTTPLSTTSTQTSTKSTPETTISTPEHSTSTPASTTSTPESPTSTPESSSSIPASTTSSPASTTSTSESSTSTPESNTSTLESTTSTEANNTLVTTDSPHTIPWIVIGPILGIIGAIFIVIVIWHKCCRTREPDPRRNHDLAEETRNYNSYSPNLYISQYNSERSERREATLASEL